jgi:hypothetical protein
MYLIRAKKQKWIRKFNSKSNQTRHTCNPMEPENSSKHEMHSKHDSTLETYIPYEIQKQIWIDVLSSN